MQDSLPAGGLRLCRAGVEPTGSLREVSDHLIPLPRAFPGAIIFGLYVVEAASDGAPEAALGHRLAVYALETPTVTLVQPLILRAPTPALATRSPASGRARTPQGTLAGRRRPRPCRSSPTSTCGATTQTGNLQDARPCTAASTRVSCRPSAGCRSTASVPRGWRLGSTPQARTNRPTAACRYCAL